MAAKNQSYLRLFSAEIKYDCYFAFKLAGLKKTLLAAANLKP